MPLLVNPSTGQHVRASHATARRLVSEEGFVAVEETAYPAAQVEAEPKSKPEKTAPPAGGEGTIPAPDKPLDEMKLGELIEYGQKIGMADDALAALKKPGASKTAAKDAINAHLAAAQQ